MRRNCLIAIVIWLALIAGYALYLRDWLRPPELFAGAFLMGTAVGCGLLMFNAARHAIRDANARARLARGERPRDGDLVAAAGEIRPSLDALTAPFSDRACVLYKYEIRTVREGEARAKDYVGFAFARCSVHTAYGSFALGSFPVLEGFGWERGDVASAARYVASTQFTRMDSVLAIAKEAFGLHRKGPPFRIDWAIGDPPQSLEDALAVEMIVAGGTRVIAFGRYSARDQSIVADDGDQGYLRMRPHAEQERREAGAIGKCIAGLMVIGAAHLILWALLTKFS